MQPLERFLKRLLIRLIGLFLSRPTARPDDIPVDDLHRILIVRQHDQLGDLLISTPAIRAVRRRFPTAHLAVVVREYTAPMMANNPHVNEVIVFYEKLTRWNYARLRWFWKTLRRGFDCAVVLNTVSRSFSSDMIALMSKAKYIVGPDHPVLFKPEQFYNVIVHRSPEPKTQIELNLEIVKTLGAETDDLEYDLVLTEEEKNRAERIFRSLSIPPGRVVVGIHFGTLDITRRFPLHKLAAVIDTIVDRFGVEIVLIVGPNEVELRKEMISMLHHAVYSAPLMPLRVSAGFMGHMRLFVCNDTGTLHIASSQRVPTVSFHSTNDPAIWKPPHPRHIAVRAVDEKIESITVDRAVEAIEEALGS